MKRYRIAVVSLVTGGYYYPAGVYRWKWLARLVAQFRLPDKLTWRYEILESRG